MALSQETVKVACIRFTYTKVSDNPDNFENLPFYLDEIRGLLRRGEGRVMWLKGARGTREAYMLWVPDVEVEADLVRTFSLKMKDGGYMKPIARADAAEILSLYYKGVKSAVGILDLGGRRYGEPLPAEDEKPSNQTSPLFLGDLRYDFKQCFEKGEYLHLIAVTITHPNNPNYREIKEEDWLRKQPLTPCAICGSNPTDRCTVCGNSYCADHWKHKENLNEKRMDELRGEAE